MFMQSSRRKHCLALFALAMVLVAMLAGDVLACPTCKSAISGGDPVSVARATGYFYSILFMMSMPFVIIGTFGGLAYFSIRKARAQHVASDGPSSADSQSLS
jgi:uncharacterized paraquat-inducible protein A